MPIAAEPGPAFALSAGFKKPTSATSTSMTSRHPKHVVPQPRMLPSASGKYAMISDGDVADQTYSSKATPD